MNGITPASCLWLFLTIAMVTAPCTSEAKETATGEFHLIMPAGPFEQWQTITLDIEPVTMKRGQTAASSGDVELVITTPSGSEIKIPAFQAFAETTDAEFQCRFTPREVGTYQARIESADATDSLDSLKSFQVNKSRAGRGFLRVDRNQPYFLLFDNGEQFRGIGTNLGWEPRRRRNAKFTYDALFPRFSAHGLNTIRTWICPWNMPVEWNSPRLGEYDQNALRRLDEMLTLAKEHGIYVVLVLGYHGELQTESGAFPNNDRWKENPYNVVNGGPCKTPAEFFTSEEAKEFYKKRLRMLVARVAGNPQLLAWEFWNEIDHIERRGPVPGQAIVAWHEEMTDYLRQIDPYDHPITTSISVEAPEGLWEIEDLDLIMLHPYGKTDKFPKLLNAMTKRYSKPTIAGEFSYSWMPAKKNEEDDFERELKLGLWRGLMSPTPILPMSWWWEYHDSRDDWEDYEPVAKCSREMTALHASHWEPVELDIEGHAIESHGVRVGNHAFLWLYNHADTTASNVRVVVRHLAGDIRSATTLSTITGNTIHKQSVSRSSDNTAITVAVPSLRGKQDALIVFD